MPLSMVLVSAIKSGDTENQNISRRSEGFVYIYCSVNITFYRAVECQLHRDENVRFLGQPGANYKHVCRVIPSNVPM